MYINVNVSIWAILVASILLGKVEFAAIIDHKRLRNPAAHQSNNPTPSLVCLTCLAWTPNEASALESCELFQSQTSAKIEVLTLDPLDTHHSGTMDMTDHFTTIAHL
jgi:hypothetical protein